MSQGWRLTTMGLLAIQAACLAGCAGPQTATLPVQRESLAADLGSGEAPRVARLQQSDAPQVKIPIPSAAPLPVIEKPNAVNLPTLPNLPTPAGALKPISLPPADVVPPPPGTKQTSLTVSRPNRITVRAWVNGKPIFDDEVVQNIPPSALNALGKLPADQRAEKLTELFNQTLDLIIEQEVVYQEAVRKLEKINPTTLDKLKGLAEQDFDKQISKIVKAGAPADQVKEFQRMMRRPMERSFISMEYMRSRIFPLINQGIGYTEIKDYYDAHPNEFQKVESVKWQDVFIAVNAQRPTVAAARQFAEDLILQCRIADDFVKLVQYDDGPSKFRGGEGTGTRRGEIQPAELEDHLFKLRNGEIGPIVELSTGVHLFRLVSRDPGGQIPLNEATQNQIRNKLRNQLADREYKRIARELRTRSVVEVVRDAD